MSKMTDYKADLIQRYWKYRKTRFPNSRKYFDRSYVQDGRPPVFIWDESWRNVIINPNANQEEINKLLEISYKNLEELKKKLEELDKVHQEIMDLKDAAIAGKKSYDKIPKEFQKKLFTIS